jgi:hypothetical protein
MRGQVRAIGSRWARQCITTSGAVFELRGEPAAIRLCCIDAHRAARGAAMSNRGLWLEGGTTFPDNVSRALAVSLAIAWVLLIAARNTQPLFTSRFECGSDPWDFLRIGEMVEESSLRVIVDAHCTNARYLPDGWIELRYGGGRIDVEVRRVNVGGATYYQVVSIGGVAAP